MVSLKYLTLCMHLVPINGKYFFEDPIIFATATPASKSLSSLYAFKYKVSPLE